MNILLEIGEHFLKLCAHFDTSQNLNNFKKNENTLSFSEYFKILGTFFEIKKGKEK